jgi:predicted RNA methylase
VIPSKEQGFRPSDSKKWFDDEQYAKDLCAKMSFNSNKDYYFGSYSHFNIHEEMLKDRARTEAYKNAIAKNRHLFEGKTILDIGTGTGILSLFAVTIGGAKKVYAVDNADIAYFAMDIVKEAKLNDKIKVIKGKIEDVKEIKEGSIDVIISEWMGYFLLYESMLDSIITVRDKYLKKGGTIWPNRA